MPAWAEKTARRRAITAAVLVFIVPVLLGMTALLTHLYTMVGSAIAMLMLGGIMYLPMLRNWGKSVEFRTKHAQELEDRLNKHVETALLQSSAGYRIAVAQIAKAIPDKTKISP